MMPHDREQVLLRPNRASYPPTKPSPLRRDSALLSPLDGDGESAIISRSSSDTNPETTFDFNQTVTITNSTALGDSMAFTGLQLDVGYTNATSWSYPPPFSYEYSTTSTTISPNSLHRGQSFASPGPSMTQPSSKFSQGGGSDEFGYRSPSYLPTPVSFLNDADMPAVNNDLTWTPTDQAFHEPCHLAISEDDAHLGHDSFQWRNAPFWERNPETGSTMSDPSCHSAMAERESSQETHNSLSRDTSYAPSSRTPSIQPDAEPQLTKRRLTRPEDVRLRCPHCDKGFARTFNYNTHLQIHNPNRRRPCRCLHPGCDKDFFRDTDLRRHEQSVHSNCKAFRCEDCLARFPRKDSLQRHITDGCIRRPAVEKRALKLRRQKLRQQKRQSHGPSGAVEDLRACSPNGSDVDESEYTTTTDALRLLRASAEPATKIKAARD